jgi:hypothetical protein
MYLPNSGLHPTGFEAGEFIEVTRMADEGFPMPRPCAERAEPTATPFEDTQRKEGSS